MKIANTLSALMIALNFLALTSNVAEAAYDDYLHFRKGTYDFQIDTQYFKTDANYISSGDTFTGLLNNQSYEITNIYFKTRYDLSRRSSLYGHVNAANATSHGFDASRTNSSVPDMQLGYAYLLMSDSFDVITDFNVIIPFYKVSENTDSAINSEGVLEAAALLRLQKAITPILGFAYVGADFRQSRSSLLPWGVGLEFAYPSWSIGGKVFGYQSITDDPDTANKTQRNIVLNRVNAGSFKFYSINPSLIDSEVFAKLRFKKAWTVAAGVGSTVTGSDSAAGLHGGVSLMYTWDSEPSYYLKQDDSISSERKVPKFKEEINDGVDQNLFQKKITPQPTPRNK